MTFLSEGKDFNTVYDRLIRYKIFKKYCPKTLLVGNSVHASYSQLSIRMWQICLSNGNLLRFMWQARRKLYLKYRHQRELWWIPFAKLTVKWFAWPHTLQERFIGYKKTAARSWKQRYMVGCKLKSLWWIW